METIKTPTTKSTGKVGNDDSSVEASEYTPNGHADTIDKEKSSRNPDQVAEMETNGYDSDISISLSFDEESESDSSNNSGSSSSSTSSDEISSSDSDEERHAAAVEHRRSFGERDPFTDISMDEKENNLIFDDEIALKPTEKK